jgi:hypothetical protein
LLVLDSSEIQGLVITKGGKETIKNYKLKHYFSTDPKSFCIYNCWTPVYKKKKIKKEKKSNNII